MKWALEMINGSYKSSNFLTFESPAFSDVIMSFILPSVMKILLLVNVIGKYKLEVLPNIITNLHRR